MADKKYVDFPAGTYDPEKIFLQADATSGELEKVNLPNLPIGRTLSLFCSIESTPDVLVTVNQNDFGGDVSAGINDTGDFTIYTTGDTDFSSANSLLLFALFMNENWYVVLYDVSPQALSFITKTIVGNIKTDIDARLSILFIQY